MAAAATAAVVVVSWTMVCVWMMKVCGERSFVD